jgi:hypothetical protein
MARIVVKRGLEEATVSGIETIADLRDNAIVQAIGIPENPEFYVDGVALAASTSLEEGDVVEIRAKASQKA